MSPPLRNRLNVFMTESNVCKLCSIQLWNASNSTCIFTDRNYGIQRKRSCWIVTLFYYFLQNFAYAIFKFLQIHIPKAATSFRFLVIFFSALTRIEYSSASKAPGMLNSALVNIARYKNSYITITSYGLCFPTLSPKGLHLQTENWHIKLNCGIFHVFLTERRAHSVPNLKN